MGLVVYCKEMDDGVPPREDDEGLDGRHGNGHNLVVKREIDDARDNGHHDQELSNAKHNQEWKH